MAEIEKTDEQWRNELGEEAFLVCRLGATEAPFSGALLNNSELGYYLCRCCATPLFHSKAKFDAGCGWPSFDDVVQADAIRYLDDTSHNMRRTEVRCGYCDAHLGHLFTDGPTQTGLRYCINSVAMDFQSQKPHE
jgi:peptide-methionine (R)-S-oxide reductase